jgi:hypothetical protein
VLVEEQRGEPHVLAATDRAQLGAWARHVHLRAFAGRPGGVGGRHRLGRVGERRRGVAAVVVPVEDDAHTGPPVQLEDVGRVEEALVVLDGDARAGPLGEPLVGRRPAGERRPTVAVEPAHVQHDGAFGPLAERVEEERVLLEVERRLACHLRVGGVQHRVLARMGREPQAVRARLGAERGELVGAGLDLAAVVEVGEVRVRPVGHRPAREPEHAHVDAVQVVERGVEELERPPQVRAALPPAVSAVRSPPSPRILAAKPRR